MGKCKHILDTARAEVPKAAHAAAEAAERPIRAAINCPVLLEHLINNRCVVEVGKILVDQDLTSMILVSDFSVEELVHLKLTRHEAERLLAAAQEQQQQPPPPPPPTPPPMTDANFPRLPDAAAAVPSKRKSRGSTGSISSCAAAPARLHPRLGDIAPGKSPAALASRPNVGAAPPVVDAAPAALQTLAGHNGAAPSPLSGRSDPEFFAMMRRMYLKP